jgi:hypothetical protein
VGETFDAPQSPII